LNAASENWEQLPAALRGPVEAQFIADETPICWFEFDLDDRLHYARGLLVLTNQRLIDAASSGEVRCWKASEMAGLRAKEHAGIGALSLLGTDRLLARWCYTIGRSPQAHRLIGRFDRVRQGEADGEEDAAAPPTTVCPSCGAILAADQKKCPDCGSIKDKPISGAMHRLMVFSRPHLGMTLLGILLMAASSAVGLIPTYLTGPLIDDVLIPAFERPGSVSFHLAWLFLLGFIGASVLAWLLTWGRTYVMAWVSERVAADLRDQTYRHMQSLSLEFFGGKRTGDLIARVSTDTDRICYFLSVYVLDFASDVLTLLMISAILVHLDPLLALATLVPLPLIALMVHQVRNRLRRGFALGTRAWAEMTSVLADTIPGIRVVKAFAQERREVERFLAANDRVFRANCRVNALWSFFGPVVSLLTALGLAVIWGYGAWRVFQHDLTVGALSIFVGYLTRFYGRMDSMSRIVAAVQRAGASANRIFAILDRVPSVAEPVQPVHIERLRGEVEFRGVGFHYGARPVLHDVNLTVRPGEMIGLVGPSGAGKTTIVNLACRFYDVSEGAILVDGVDIRSFSLAEYRRNVGVVLQDPFLFYGTIAENIAYGRPDASRREIVEAARAARAHEFILRLPDAYDSLVGERGQLLSGGERQRISIARALLIDPRILILDEATSSVDTETEREIQLALENLIQGRTTIAIAHRLSTLRRADRLVVVERGRITEIGPHDQLLKKQGAYARLHHAQFHMNLREGMES